MVLIHTFTNQKGGVGKTTTAFHWAHFLAERKGAKVLCIDLDAQGNFSSRHRSQDETEGFPSVELFSDNFDPSQTPYKVSDKIDLIYASNGDNALADVETRGLGAVPVFFQNLQAFTEQHEYDYVVIDTPPTNGARMVSAAVVADKIVVPIELAAFAVDGVSTLHKTISSISEQIGQDIRISAIICNKYQSRLTTHKQAIDDIKSVAGDIVLKNTLSNRGAFDESLSVGAPVWTGVRTGAAREASKEMLATLHELWARLEGKGVHK